MNLQKELVYKEYIDRENEITRAPYSPELEFYSVIKSGDIEKTRELCEQSFESKEGLGILSKNSLQNYKYHFAITTALIARYCIEGGMAHTQAYELSDFYIEKADRATSIKAISILHNDMCVDYARRMQILHRGQIYSKHISSCIDYIYDHLHTRITVEILAEYVALNPTYLSKLFKKETGLPISSYIQQKKIETAQKMLAYSEYSISEIASTLAFPSQSYFTEVFKKITDVTPHEYREKQHRSINL